MMAHFQPGTLVFTRNVNDLVAESTPFTEFVLSSLSRHCHGDWGDVCAEDKSANNRAVVEGDRVLSAYGAKWLPKIWIISESDRSVTTVLFPDEY
jgi:hypothetical protein